MFGVKIVCFLFVFIFVLILTTGIEHGWKTPSVVRQHSGALEWIRERLGSEPSTLVYTGMFFIYYDATFESHDCYRRDFDADSTCVYFNAGISDTEIIVFLYLSYWFVCAT